MKTTDRGLKVLKAISGVVIIDANDRNGYDLALLLVNIDYVYNYKLFVKKPPIEMSFLFVCLFVCLFVFFYRDSFRLQLRVIVCSQHHRR